MELLSAADANFDETHGREQMGPDEVGSHRASDSPYGLSDMSGNAFEWTTSAFAPGQYVGRGGSFFYDRKTIQLVNRAVSSPEIRDASLGVRMCADIVL
jgi:formylglycine-generating enzyme required for sulfatase activity